MANLNTSQIISMGAQYGQNVSNDEAQNIMNNLTQGGNPDAVTNYFTQQQTQQNNQNGVTSAANAATTNFNNQSAADDASVTGFLSKYQGDVNNAVTGANATFNIPSQVSNVNALNTRINDLSNNTSNSAGGAESGTGLGGYNSEAQVGAEINDRELPQLNAATTNLNTSETAAQNQENIELQPDQAYGQLLATNITAAMSGLSQADQTTLQGYMDQLDQGTALTEEQMTTANNLAVAAINNANAITVAQINQQGALAVQQSSNTAPIPVPAASKVFNPVTGTYT